MPRSSSDIKNIEIVSQQNNLKRAQESHRFNRKCIEQTDGMWGGDGSPLSAIFNIQAFFLQEALNQQQVEWATSVLLAHQGSLAIGTLGGLVI